MVPCIARYLIEASIQWIPTDALAPSHVVLALQQDWVFTIAAWLEYADRLAEGLGKAGLPD